MQKFGAGIHKIALRIGKADFAYFLLPPLMALLFIGTIAQKEIGLYAAHKFFFASFILWIGPLPLPGGYLLITLLTLPLLCKFLFNSEWKMAKAGINLTHLGVLVMLLGGLLTALFARENYMVIAEGQQTPYIYNYIDRELVISSESGIEKVPFGNIKANAKINLPFNLRVHERCTNCTIEKREESAQNFGNKEMQSFARFMALKPKAKEKTPEANLSGLTFEISGLKNNEQNEKQNGIYIAFEAMPKPIKITHNNREYELIFGKAQRTLPFALKLIDFEKQSYPGTNKAREYSSDIEVIDGDVHWPARIAMNEPLRYKGYTFFQSSFERTEDTEITILSVVRNRGRLFPYIGTGIIAAGLLLHIFLMMRRKKKA